MLAAASLRWISRIAGTLATCLVVAACSTAPPADPVQALETTGERAPNHLAAVEALSKQDPLSKSASNALKRTLNGSGYNNDVRKAAFNVLAEKDRKVLEDALAVSIVRMENYEFRRWIIEQIGKRDMKDFTVVLLNSWIQPLPHWGMDDRERPEYAAMVEMYGTAHASDPSKAPLDTGVTDALFAVLQNSSPVTQAALRARTWELLMRLGQRERLRELVHSAALRPDDAMLKDIKQLSDDLGILPETREELIWLGKLRMTASPAFWKMASDALKLVPEEQKRNFELRGITVAVAAAKYKPELLKKTTDELYALVAAQLKSRGAGKYSPNFQGFGEGHTEMLGEQRDQICWIDLMAIVLAMDLTDQPAIRAKLFDVADRDQQDRRTEYGGVVRLSDKGEYEVVEVRPRMTGSDVRYEASQEAFDEGYTALFHFHMHAQEYENSRYAGPHLGDFAYAASSRANCLVFSFVKRDALDVDFYRHGPVVVDLGTIPRG